MDAQSPPSPVPETRDVFKHEPLDHSEPSIRLVQVLSSLSPDGHIQCTILHATTSATYTCLSYRWGDPSPSREILVNGKVFTVRQNLFDFLSSLYTKVASVAMKMSEPYWIDALTIDQANILERNHQVTQMGQVYSNAEVVHIWLGVVPPSLLPVFQVIRTAKVSTCGERPVIIDHTDDLARHVTHDDYWTRAWITQEIVLARRVAVWLDAELIDFGKFTKGIEDLRMTTQFTPKPFHLSQLIQHTQHTHMWFRGDNLIALLAQFHDKQCGNPRDRVYSLLSLCSDKGRNLDVDYNISEVHLAVQVLSRYEESLCLCSAAVVVQALGLADIEPQSHDDRNVPFFEFDVAADMLMPSATLRYIYRYNIQIPNPEGRGNYFNFHDTCESHGLYQFKIFWDECEAAYKRVVHFSHRGGSQSAFLYGGDEFEFIINKVQDGVFTVRISLWLLAKMITYPVGLCRHTKLPRTIRKDVRIGGPRIRYGSGDAPHEIQNEPIIDDMLGRSLHLHNQPPTPKQVFLKELQAAEEKERAHIQAEREEQSHSVPEEVQRQLEERRIVLEEHRINLLRDHRTAREGWGERPVDIELY